MKHIVGIIGAGQMGTGIAYVVARAGHQVTLFDRIESQLEKASENIKKNIKKDIKNNIIQKHAAEKLQQQLNYAKEINQLKNSSIIIESVVEDEKVKQKVFLELKKITGKDCILASNTSSISITRLAATTDRPQKFIGVHFMNPVPKMKLVEIIKGFATDDKTYNTIVEFVEGCGKEIVTSEDFPAFIVNRILLPMINEAIYALYEGVANIDSIDKAMRLGTKHPMGPLQLADFVGLDTCLSIMQVLHDGLADSKYRPCPLLIKYVDAGWLGVKTGKGFYDYSFAQPKPTR